MRTLVFPWIVAVIFLALLAVALLMTFTPLWYRLRRQEVLPGTRPSLTSVAWLTFLLLAALVAWGLIFRPT